MLKNEELPVMGVPYYAGHTHNPYRRGKGVLIQQVIYGFTPAPFNCFYCSNSGLTLVPRPCAVMDPPQGTQKSFALLTNVLHIVTAIFCLLLLL